MNELTVFEHPSFGQMRGMTINGEPWFVGRDVAALLGYSNTRDALSKHVENEDKNTVAFRDGTSGNPNQTIINESGVYSLIFSSKLPMAKQFKHWVTAEVLPSIRKTGKYAQKEATKTADLLRCAEIIARCPDANLPYVLRILNMVIPGLMINVPDQKIMPETGHDRSGKVSRVGYTVPFDYRKLDALMRERNLTNKELEQMIGCPGTHSTVARWRTGAASPGTEYRLRLCKAFSLKPGSFDW